MKNWKIPDKMIYKLEDVCRIANLELGIIESWEKELYFLHSGKTASGEKIFRKKDLAIIIRLKELLEEKGFTLAGAKRRIEEEFGLKTPVPVHPDRLKNVLYRVKEELQEIASTLEKE